MVLAELLKDELSKGRFWQKAWSLVEGCTPISPGCAHCWLASMSRRFSPDLNNFKGAFNGIITHRPDRLDIPLRRRKPTVYAIWSDLFHEGVPFAFILKVLTTMALTPRHHFIIVTKRAKRCADILAGSGGWPKKRWQRRLSQEAYDLYGEEAECRAHNAIEGCLGEGHNVGWPLSNVTILVTMEDQQRADERACHAMALSNMGWAVGALCEPMLGPIMLDQFGDDEAHFDTLRSTGPGDGKFSWVICGPENGPGKRPFDTEWAASLRDQARAAGVPFLYKADGGYLFGNGESGRCLEVPEI